MTHSDKNSVASVAIEHALKLIRGDQYITPEQIAMDVFAPIFRVMKNNPFTSEQVYWYSSKTKRVDNIILL